MLTAPSLPTILVRIVVPRLTCGQLSVATKYTQPRLPSPKRTLFGIFPISTWWCRSAQASRIPTTTTPPTRRARQLPLRRPHRHRRRRRLRRHQRRSRNQRIRKAIVVSRSVKYVVASRHGEQQANRDAVFFSQDVIDLAETGASVHANMRQVLNENEK